MFELSIPQIMPVMSALVFSIMIGLAAAWTKAELISDLLEEFQKIVGKNGKRGKSVSGIFPELNAM